MLLLCLGLLKSQQQRLQEQSTQILSQNIYRTIEISSHENIKGYFQTLALATFHWDGDQDWPDFVAKVTSVADCMFAQFNNEIEENVTQYIQFKTGGFL